MSVSLQIANTVTDLIQGDVREHLPLERIPLRGDVLGLGTTSGWDNGELTFLQEGDAGDTRIWKSQPADGRVVALEPGSGLQHFPYVCFSGDATALRCPAPPACLGPRPGVPLQERIAEAMAFLQAEGVLEAAPIYGMRLRARWQSLVITVASKLCLGELRRNEGVARLLPGGAAARAVGASIYERLPHFRLSAQDPADPADPVRWLGASLHWEGCGFWDTRPESGRVTVPVAGAHLHLHGCSTDLRHGGHLHHEHPDSVLADLEHLVLYPLQHLQHLASDLAVSEAHWHAGELRFTVINHGSLDASDVDVVVVIDDRFSDHRHLCLPWLEAGGRERFAMPLPLPAWCHELEVVVDPERRILEPGDLRDDNRARLVVHGDD